MALGYTLDQLFEFYLEAGFIVYAFFVGMLLCSIYFLTKKIEAIYHLKGTASFEYRQYRKVSLSKTQREL